MKNTISMLLFIIVLGTILASSLVAINYFTESRIARNTAITLKKSVLAALHISYSEPDMENVYAAQVTEKTVKDTIFYVSQTGETAFYFEGNGLWGPITGMLALAADRITVKCLVIIHQEETPGLGSRIVEAAYLNSYLDKSFSPQLSLKGSRTGNQQTEVDSITGATMSCNALVTIVNSNYQKRKALLEEIK